MKNIESNIYKTVILRELAPRIEGCLNEIRIQTLNEIKDLKSVVVNLNEPKIAKLVRNEQVSSELFLSELISMSKNDFIQALDYCNNSEEGYSKLKPIDIISLLKKISNSFSYSFPREILVVTVNKLLYTLNLEDVPNESLNTLFSAIKSLENEEFINSNPDNTEIYFIIGYIKRKLVTKISSASSIKFSKNGKTTKK